MTIIKNNNNNNNNHKKMTKLLRIKTGTVTSTRTTLHSVLLRQQNLIVVGVMMVVVIVMVFGTFVTATATTTTTGMSSSSAQELLLSRRKPKKLFWNHNSNNNNNHHLKITTPISSSQQHSTITNSGLEFLHHHRHENYNLNVVATNSVLLSSSSAASSPVSYSRRQQHANVDNNNNDDHRVVLQCSSGAAGAVLKQRSIYKTLLRGSLLRIASDLSGGTPLESIKTRVTISSNRQENFLSATQSIMKEKGFFGFYVGTSSRTIEGALIGAVFMGSSIFTKKQLLLVGCSPTIAALMGGLVGGVAQAVIMTPAGLVFTSLAAVDQSPSSSSSLQHRSNENAYTILRRIIQEKGVKGLYAGGGAMCIRQATNWASRAGLTEVARTTFGLTKYGLVGELISGMIGGVGSCWNTPIETIRVVSQRDLLQQSNYDSSSRNNTNKKNQVVASDISSAETSKSMIQYYNEIKDEYGYAGLFRGVTPRAIQAIWQTTFLVVVPNLMGI